MKKQLQIIVAVIALMTTTSIAFAQNTSQSNSPKKMRVFIAPTQDGFSNFLSAALLENKVPVEITADEENANYIIVCNGVKGQNKWYDTVFGVEKDRNQGSMKLIRVSDKSVVWASASGDKSFWFSEFKSMGQSKVANRLARKMKGDLPKILAANEGNDAVNSDSKTQVAKILEKESTVSPNALIAPTTKTRLTADEYNQTGVSLFGEKKYVEAENNFREAIKLEPYNAACHYNLGTALHAQSKFDEAEKEIELATRLAPNEEIYKKSLEIVRMSREKRTIIKNSL